MFTGLIRHTGEIVNINEANDFISVEVKCQELAITSEIGDSISVDGICLTISKLNNENLAFDLVSETLKRTNAKNWKVGRIVHLEPAMQLQTRLDGHLISGHIDTLVPVMEVNQKPNALMMSFALPKEFEGYVIEKGSVTLDGVSLTVSDLSIDGEGQAIFSVWLIPTTMEKTHLAELKVGDEVNLEVDLIGKYVVQNLKRYGQ
jgi:riboflavin synthase